jgi:hypothetical protein
VLLQTVVAGSQTSANTVTLLCAMDARSANMDGPRSQFTRASRYVGALPPLVPPNRYEKDTPDAAELHAVVR